MASYVRDYLPLITPRIEFLPTPPSPLPSITPRVEYTPEFIAYLRSLRRSGGTGGEEGEEDDEQLQVQQGRSHDGDDRPQRRVPTTTSPPNRAGSAGPSSANQKIPKPLGQPGRPGSGGFSVPEVLIGVHGWTKEQVADLNVTAVRDAAQAHLDMTICFRLQNKAAVKTVCDELTKQDRWPNLDRYDDCWPVRSMLQLALKTRVQAAKRTNDKQLAGRLVAAMRGSSPGDGSD